MSADNWRTCPACELRAAGENVRRTKAAEKAYGKVSASEYEELKRLAGKDAAAELEDTFREDYETAIGHSKRGPHVFFVVYKGSCTSCGFSHSFEHYDDLANKVAKVAEEDS